MKWAWLVVVSLASAAHAEPRRILSIGSATTECVFALGAGGELVGVDSSSLYPAEATRLPQVGYQRSLNAEGIAALRPTLVLAGAEAGPPAVLERVRAAGIRVVSVPSEPSLAGVRRKIAIVAEAIGERTRGEALLLALDRELAEAQALVKRARSRPRALVVYARGAGTLNVGGRSTPADEMLRLAGADNAAAGIEGWKPINAESLVDAQPTVVVVPSLGLRSLGGKQGLLKVPGMSLTPAGKAGAVEELDDLLLLGFGPRIGQAVTELARRLHPELR